jgi:PAS domain S-box-containing protein
MATKKRSNLKQFERDLKQLNTELEERVRQRTAELETANRQLKQEITERKHIEEQLFETNQRLHSLMQALPVGVSFSDDATCQRITGNPALLAQLEITPQDNVSASAPDANAAGRQVHYFRGGSEITDADLPLQRAVAEKQSVPPMELEIVLPSGRRWFSEASSAPILDAKGKVLGGVAVTVDVTGRKRAEKALEKSKERFELLSETASRLLATDKPQRIVNELCERVMTFLDCHAFFNFLVDDDERRLRLNAYAGIPEHAAKDIEWLDYGVAVCGCAARDAFRIVAENIPETPDPRTDLVKSYGIKAYACHPLLSAGRVIGTLSFGTRTRTHFSDEDLSLMKTVADQVATAMEKMNLIEALRKSRDGLDIRVQERTTELMSVIEALQEEMAERKQTEQSLRKLTYDLNERVKEINCLYSVCYQVERQYPLSEEKFKNIVREIPSGWQYPEIACARIILEDKEYKTDNFSETPWKLASDIIVHGEAAGRVEVYYLEEREQREEGEEGLFLKEERTLINTIAIELGEMIGHMRSDKALDDQSRVLEAFFTSTITPLVFLDRNFNFVRVNLAYAKACQRDISEFEGHNHFEFYPSDAKPIFEDVVHTRVPYQAIARPFVFSDHPERGTTYWNWTLTPILDDTGETEFLVFSLEDVTERKRAEEVLKAASLYARTLIEASPDPLVTISKDGKIMDVNSATEQVTGLSRGQLIGSDFSDYFTEPEKAREGYKKVFVEGLVRDYPLAIQHVSGPITDVLYNATVYRNEVGEVQGVFAAARDITKRKRAEEALKAASLYARTLIEASLDPLVTISKDGRIMDVNSATEQVTGFSRGQLIGSDFSDYFTEPEKAREGYQRVFLDEVVRDYSLAIRHTSGKVTDVLYNAAVYRNDAGEVQGVFAAARDITKRKRAQEALQESEKALRYLSSQLMAAQENERKRIARDLHDGLGQLLTAIKFKVESFLQEMGPSKMKTKAKPLEAVIPMIQECVRESHRIQMNLRPSMLDDLGILVTISWLCREFGATYPGIHIEREIDIQEEEIHESLKLVICRILQEVLNNISKHSQADRVRISLTKTERAIELSVQDNGKGFDPKETLSADGSKRGMGLSSMKERAEYSGGAFSVESAKGEGTRIRVSWPI